MRDPLGFLSSLIGGAPVLRIQLGTLPVVLVCDPDLTWNVLLDDRTFDKGGPFYERSREVAGGGLGTCPHTRHRRQRRLCQPAFRIDRLPGYAEVATASVQARLRSWCDGHEVDVVSQMSELTVDIAVRTMFSTSLPEQVIRRAASDVGVLAAGLFRRTVMPSALNRVPTPANRRFLLARDRVRGLGAELIRHRRGGGDDQGDLLSALISAHDPRSPGAAATLTDEELIDQVFTFFLAGAETTASTLVWALYLLGRDPRSASTVHAEVDTALAGRTAVVDDLTRLPFLSRVVTETLRLYPPGWLLTRITTAATLIDDISIPAGTTVAVSPHLIHRRPDLYLDPDAFVPDRWIGLAPPRTAFIPFGAGARRCIGDQFALTTATLALAHITAAWRLSPVRAAPTVVALKDLPAPRCLPMRLSTRQPQSLQC
ncbi:MULTISPECIES: cytochrome P450 [unclassified Nocardia]|uniref:cytochrome P450 n=1 Tax=unclassified Nocardia TaxID=2637762 RepID=UPI0024A8414E|nr:MULTISPECIES: cytochrome P450 [unclassified Nocardia]